MEQIVTTQFAREDWVRIKNALMFYVIKEEEKLISSNAGDREWTELEEYNTLIGDIELFVLNQI